MIPSLKRVAVAAVAFLMVVPWAWRRVWTASAVVDWEQADLDDDVVPEDVWNAIVAVIEGQDDAWLLDDDDD